MSSEINGNVRVYDARQRDDRFVDVLDLISGMLDRDGEIMVPFRGNGEWGTLKIVRKITIAAPTKEKIFEVMQELRRENFRGNVYVPSELVEPFVVRCEEYRDVGQQLLLEGRRQKKS